MGLISFLKNTFLYNSKKRFSKTNIFVIVGVFLFFLSSVITISTSIPIITHFVNYSVFYKETMVESLAKLRAGAQITSFQTLIGDPTFVNDIKQRDDGSSSSIKLAKKEYVFVNRYFYLDALIDANGNVTQFAVTTRDSNFNPAFKSPIYTSDGKSFNIVLGKSRYSDISEEPDLIRGCLGAHNWYYYETYYIGNLSNYENICLWVKYVGL